MRTLAFLLLFAHSCLAAEPPRDGMIPMPKFVLSAPTNGTYAPWRDPKDAPRLYAGELITITNASFHYTYFSDVVGGGHDYSGTVSVFKDHIYLNHPGIQDPYRVAGVADGVPVLFTSRGYEQLKETGKVSELNVLGLPRKSGQ
jgi:hypothetical protein